MPYVQINYKRIHYRDVAPSNGSSPHTTLILLHGLGSTQNFYVSLTPALAEAGYRCLSFDMTGMGRSPYTFVEQSVTSLATDIIDFMDALSVSKAALVGHSMSAGLTVPQAAALWPDRVQGAVLIGPVYPSKELTPVFAGRIEQVQKNGMEAMGETVPFAAPGSAAKPLHRAFIRELLMQSDPAGYVSLCRVIADAHAMPPEYGKVSCPTLIIAGEEDKSAPVGGCEKILKALGTEEKSKKMVVQSKMGHWHCVEDPEDTGKHILGFLKSLQQSGQAHL